MTWITMVFGLACLVCGMACVLISFIVFKPLIMDLYGTLSMESKRQILASQQQQRAGTKTMSDPEPPRSKSDKSGIVKPSSINNEDVI